MNTIDRPNSPVPTSPRMSTPSTARSLLLVTLLLAVFGSAIPLAADPIIVETSAATSTTFCTLGDAIATARQGQAVGACSWAPDPYVKLAKKRTYLLDAPVLVDIPLVIKGDFSPMEPATIRFMPGQSSRFFDVAPGASLQLSNLKLSGGSAFDGGAVRIQASASAVFMGVVFFGNSAPYTGGAIDNAGTITVEKSTFEGNSAAFGGAVHNHGNSSAEVEDSLFDSNSAIQGGAFFHRAGSLDIETSTFSSNHGDFGGAIFGKSGAATVDFATFRNNTSSSGTAIFMEWGTLDLGRSLLTDSSGQSQLCVGSQYIGSSGGNVLSDGSCTSTIQDDVVGQAVAMSDLHYQGGHTRVHVPLCDWQNGQCDSPAFDRDDLPLCAPGGNDRDQRDQFDRLSIGAGPTVIGGGDACDVGAYESVCQGSVVEDEHVTIILHEYQVTEGDPILLDNGDCFGHPLWAEDSTSGCRLTWDVAGARLEVDDIVFLDPACQETCFPDTTLCEQNCTGGGGPSADEFLPDGWIEQDDGGTYSILVEDCHIPELAPGESMRYLIGLRDSTPSSSLTSAPLHGEKAATGTARGGRTATKSGPPLGYWDPKTPIRNDDTTDTGNTGGGD